MIVLALVWSTLAGFLLLRSIWPASKWNGWDAADWLRLPAGAFAGLGLTSIPVYLQLPAQATPPWTAECALMAVCVVLFLVFGRRGPVADAGAGQSLWMPSVWIASATAVVTAAGFYLTTRTNPHGDFDAWRIWNFRARFLFRGETLSTLNDPLLSWTHPEFPHLLTGSILRLWQWNGGESPEAPMAVAALFTIFVAMALFGAVRALRTPGQAWLALTAMLGSTLFVTAGSTQLADVPISGFLLGSLALVLCAERLHRHSLAVGAGLLAGLGAWLKFEGAFYAVGLFALALWRLRSARGMLGFVGGAAPGIAITAWFVKTSGASAPATAVGASPVNLLLAIVVRWIDWTYMGWAIMPLLVFAIYVYFAGFDRKLNRSSALTIWMPVATLFVCGFLAVVVRDDNSGDTAGIRLVLHIWPVLLLALFRHVTAVEDLALAPASASKGSQRSRK